MKRNTSIKFKAALLVMVFSLNTIIGFACSVGVDMGFNSKHHHSEEAPGAMAHVHQDGKTHLHPEKKEGHSHDKKHNHEPADKHQSSGSDKDCCTNEVMQFQDLAKTVPNLLSLAHPVYFTAFSYINISLLPYTDVVRDVKLFVRSDHPPIPDIRIAIQSFLI